MRPPDVEPEPPPRWVPLYSVTLPKPTPASLFLGAAIIGAGLALGVAFMVGALRGLDNFLSMVLRAIGGGA